MDINYCFIVWRSEFARFDTPQIKRQFNVFSICLSPPKTISDKRHCKITLFLKSCFIFWQKKSFFCFQGMKKCLQRCGIYRKKALSAELKGYF